MAEQAPMPEQADAPLPRRPLASFTLFRSAEPDLPTLFLIFGGPAPLVSDQQMREIVVTLAGVIEALDRDDPITFEARQGFVRSELANRQAEKAAERNP